MSRSYKRYAVTKDDERSLVPRRYKQKTIANRAVRRANGKLDGGGFKRLYDSWSICDWSYSMTEGQLKKEWADSDEWLHGMFGTYKQAYRWWYTSFKGK